MPSKEGEKLVKAMSAERRAATPKANFAGPHESFPINNQEDVEHAAMLLRHAKDPAAVKRHILAEIKRLGLQKPKSWQEEEDGDETVQKGAGLIIVMLKAADVSIGMPHAFPQSGAMAARAKTPAPITAAQNHLKSGPNATPNFTHQEMSLPSSDNSHQNSGNVPHLLGAAARHKEWQDSILDRGQGVGAKLGFHMVEVGEDRPLTEADIAEGHRKGGLVVMAPLKGEQRLHEKAANDFGGDYSRLRDISRATIAVSHPDDMAHVSHMLREHGMRYASAPNDRFEKPTIAGYRDIQTESLDPHGHIGELQLHTLDHLHAKELGFAGTPHHEAGHKHYEEMRTIKPKTKTVEQLTPSEQARYKELMAKSAALYGEASQRLKTRTPRFVDRPIQKALPMRKRTQTFQSRYHWPSADEIMRNADHTHRPGFFEYQGMPARRAIAWGRPEIFHSGQWHFIADIGKFDHVANRVSTARFNRMMKQHTS